MAVNKNKIVKKYLSTYRKKIVAEAYSLTYRKVCEIINGELVPEQIRELRLARAAKKYNEKLDLMKEKYHLSKL
jgi:hypothetical protein